MRTFFKILLVVGFFILIFLGAGAFLYGDVPKQLTVCSDQYIARVQEHINQIKAESWDKEKSCSVWREDLNSLEACYDQVASSRRFPNFLVQLLSKTNTMKGLYEETCGEYPL